MSAQNTRVLPYGPEAIAEAARLIAAGLPVAMPTETVYGLAADAMDAEAVARIYEAKGRPRFNPLIVHVLDIEQAVQLGACVTEAARDIADCYWPGPLTLVLPLSPFSHMPRLTTADLGTIALRSPRHRAMRDLLDRTGRPLAAPSANVSGRMSPTTAEHVRASLGGRIPLIVDDGPTEHGLESTIVKLEGNALFELRSGPIDAAAVAVLAKLKFDTAWRGRIEAPGQSASHYAPSKPLRLNAVEARRGEWLIGFGAIAGDATLSASADLVEAAANLFEKLHEAEAAAEPNIAVAPIPEAGLGAAVNDRLRRAAARP